jgi:3D (Asp-Asp-Asp) domain-containing protein
MVRDWRLLLVPAAIVVLFLFLFYIIQANRDPELKPIPKPETTEQQETGNVESKWYIQFSVNSQKSTYYTEAASAPASASAKGYYIGSGAVHPLYPLNAGGSALKPIIPFGTRLYLSKPIEVQGNTYDSLVVNDTGDVYYGLWSKYPYWVDVYAGTANYWSNKQAFNAGIDLIDYYWYEPWK